MIFLPYAGACGGRHAHGGPALRAAGLRYAYPDRTAGLDEATAEVGRGQLTLLLGPNGAGKSTLLRCAAGLLRPAAGQLEVLGHPPGQCRHQVAYLPQRGELDWAFPVSVGELVLAGRQVHLGWLRRPGREDRRLAAAALAALELGDCAHRQIGELSGGQQQRALLARALAQEAELLLLDEPFNAVDAATRLALLRVLNGLRADGRTVVLATHEHPRGLRPDRVLRMEAGRVLPAEAEEGPPGA